MRGIAERIMELASALPEAAPLCAGALLHLGARAVVDESLLRLAPFSRFVRVCQGIYMQPVETRYGPCAPDVGKVITSFSAL